MSFCHKFNMALTQKERDNRKTVRRQSRKKSMVQALAKTLKHFFSDHDVKTKQFAQRLTNEAIKVLVKDQDCHI